MNPKKIFKGIQDTKIENLQEYFKKLKEEEKKHLILTTISRSYYRIKRFFDELPLNIRTFIQRGRRGWGVSDVWSFDYYLAKTISEGLKHLKKIHHGYPCELTEGQWIDILNEMIWTFEIALKVSELEIVIPYDKESRQKLQKLEKEVNPSYRILTKKEELKYKKGFELFKKYFHNLWD